MIARIGGATEASPVAYITYRSTASGRPDIWRRGRALEKERTMADYGKAAVLDQPNGTFTVEEFPVPSPAPGTFLLRTDLNGICATDAHMYEGRFAGITFPIVLGHEITGTIDRLGSGVTEDSVGRPVREGDRVVIVPGISCGHCFYCTLAHTPGMCENGIAYGFQTPTAEYAFSGGMAQYLYVRYPQTAFLKTDLPPEIAVLTEPLCIAAHAIARHGLRLASVAVIQGSGAVGLGALLFARYAGAVKTIMVGGPSHRLALAREFGADVTIDIAEVPDPAERIRLVRAETVKQRGADVVFECTGYPETIGEGIAYLRDSARFIELGHFTDMGEIALNPHWQLMRKNISLDACWGSNFEAMALTLPYLERRDHPYEKLVSHRLPLTAIADGVRAINSRSYRLPGGGEVIKVAVAPWATSA
jgi:L-iditol 2-dehydrogenase